MDNGAVYLGASDWNHPAWLGGFYPADMPEAWQLAYYNTQFSCVWLPYSRWSQADATDMALWRDDTHAGFRFLLEQPPAGAVVAPPPVLSDRIGAVCGVDAAYLIWFEAGVDLKALTARIQARASQGPAYLLSRDADLATLDRVGTLLGLLGL
jgi:hypothetical protein